MLHHKLIMASKPFEVVLPAPAVDWVLYDGGKDSAPEVFHNFATRYQRVVALGDARAVVVYRGMNNYGYITVLNTDTAISAMLVPYTISGIHAVALNDNAVLVVYERGRKLYANIVGVGGNINIGHEVLILPDNVQYLAVSRLDNGLVYVAADDVTRNKGVVLFLNVAGGAVMVQLVQEFGEMRPAYISCDKHVLVYAQTVGGSGKLAVRVVGQGIMGDEIVLSEHGVLGKYSAVVVADNEVVIAWHDAVDNALRITVVDGVNYNVRNSFLFTDFSVEYVSLSALGAGYFLVSYGVDNGGVFSRIIHVNGAAITFYNTVQHAIGDCEYVSSCKLGDNALVVYADDGAGGVGKFVELIAYSSISVPRS